MVQRGDRPRFLLEPAGVRPLERLDGDDTVEPPIARLPDFTHVAGAERGKNLAGTDDTAGVQRHGRGHRIIAASRFPDG
jgi:hypothetical protein